MKKIVYISPVEPIICLAHRFEAIANKYVFQPMGFSAISMQILKLLKNNGPLTASELIKMTNATKSNMSQRLSFLEKEKLVFKACDCHCRDKRKITVKLTPAGKEKIDNLEKRFKKAQISFEKKFTAKEIDAHKAFIKKLNLILDSEEYALAKIFKF
ncbi:MAG: ArsR family transcriptional regulator [Candidatus Moranbacteria bacterium]|nr:ArsR family transcriptional regulator [Candidatus Moranbacteria bacterium]